MRGDETAEAAAEHHRLGQPERVAQPPQVIGPGPQIPELGAAVVTAAMPALVVEDDLDLLSERGQPRFHVDVVQADYLALADAVLYAMRAPGSVVRLRRHAETSPPIRRADGKLSP